MCGPLCALFIFAPLLLLALPRRRRVTPITMARRGSYVQVADARGEDVWWVPEDGQDPIRVARVERR